MTKSEYLLTCLIEELSEVQQEVCKCLRFTLDHKYEKYNDTNFEKVLLEFADVRAIRCLLNDIGIETENTSEKIQERFFEKIKRTERLMKESVKLGVLKCPLD